MKVFQKNFWGYKSKWWRSRDSISRRGEWEACRYLKKQGYRILAKRYWTRFGEIDVVARRGKALAFVEVKTRKGFSGPDPLEAITPYKWQRIQRASLIYLGKFFGRQKDIHLRFLAVGVRFAGARVHLEAVGLYFD